VIRPKPRLEGKIPTTSVTNELTDYINQLPGPEGGLVSLPFGITNNLIGQVMPEGPLGEPDFTDNRYWVRCCATLVQPLYAGPTQHPELGIAGGELGELGPGEVFRGDTVIVTNLAEQWGFPFELAEPGTGNLPVSFPGPHTIPHGSFIQFGQVTDRGSEADVKFRYVTFTVPKMVTMIEIVALNAGGGQYMGYECDAPTQDILPMANASILNSVGRRNPFFCSVVNFAEFGATGHSIDPLRQPNVFPLYLLRANRDGVPVYGGFLYQEPVGQFQGMIRQMVTDLTPGYDRLRGHALL
jgi:hypothetical protein